jgi:hypothetical protein
MNFNIILPERNGQNREEVIQVSNNIVLVGANGSGKTRLGAWIEERLMDQTTVHRISAQKALMLPEFATLKNLEQAEAELLYGSTEHRRHGIRWAKQHYRWNTNWATHLLDDFEKLLSLLFAKSAERDRNHTIQTRETQAYVAVPDAPIDIIVKIWTELMPHRNISFADGRVVVQKEGSPDYHGKEMSDGERVILYLIGQCLCAPANSIIIIDEPEVHIHKSIVPKLWNKVEELCQDKLLVYITHDLDFASSRNDCLKLWIKSYHGSNLWEWNEIPNGGQIPENLILEIIGNRKNVIFCEGDQSSLDTNVYQIVYSNYHVIPRGSGEKVIESTKAFRTNEALHHLNAFGLTDSDYKEEEEKRALLRDRIYTIPVAEIENLFCIEPAIRIIANHLELNADNIVTQVTEFLINALQEEFEIQVSSKAEKIIEYKLGAFSKRSHSEQGLVDALQETLSRINIGEIYAQCRREFQNAIDSRNLDQILLIYNRKSLLDRISPIFGLGRSQYSQLFIRLLKGPRRDELVAALRNYLPHL